MKTYNYIEVYTENTKVGTLALLKQSEKVAFAYTDEWIASGFSVNPLSLPLKKGVFVPKTDLLEGLFGAFADSLPDGWGRLLVDRVLMKEGIQPENVSSLNRLAIVGESGMGSLEYRPVLSLMTSIEYMEYDQMARECQKILENQNSKN